MSVIKKNIIANFVGNVWQALMGLAFIPLYIKFMGVESYGLIGIFATLQAVFVLLDMGLSATLTREIARLSVLPCKQKEMRDLVRSLEIIYWCVAVFIGIIVIALSPFVAHHWVQAGRLSSQSIEQALGIMGLAMALQWPASFYSGGLMGLQRQVLLNAINIGASTLRSTGAVLVLWLVSPTIQGFFSWQIVGSIINTGLLAFFLWRRLPSTDERGASFQRKIFADVWRFAAGMSGITFLAVMLTQLDKIVLSKMLSLELFGYYALANTVAMNLYRIISPISMGVYPRITQLVSLGEEVELKQMYHKSCQFMSVAVLPVAVVVAMFSYEILLIWTQNPVTAEKSHVLVSILICGTALNGLMNVPYGLQLAHGWIKLAFHANLISVILLVPLIIFMTIHYGAKGGASVWVILNAGYLLIAVPIMHRKLLSSEKRTWYWQDLCLPLVACVLVAGLGRIMLGNQESQLMTIVYLLIISVSTLTITAAATPTTRSWLISTLAKQTLA